MIKSSVEEHRRVFRIAEIPDAQGAGDSSLVRFLVGVLRVKKCGFWYKVCCKFNVSQCSRLRS